MKAEAGNLKSLVLAGEPGEPGKSHPENKNLLLKNGLEKAR